MPRRLTGNCKKSEMVRFAFKGARQTGIYSHIWWDGKNWLVEGTHLELFNIRMEPIYLIVKRGCLFVVILGNFSPE